MTAATETMANPVRSDPRPRAPVRPALMVCRDAAGLAWLERLAPTLTPGFTVVSDDLQVQRAAQTWPGVGEISFIEKMESFYVVADDVIALLARVNVWLVGLTGPGGIDARLLFWPEQCEGGDTTQRIQDALLLVRSYETLFARFTPSKIWLVRSAGLSWEDDLLVACAARAGIAIERVGQIGWKQRLRGWWRYWRPLAKEIYFSGAVVAEKLRDLLRSPVRTTQGKSVAVQLCDAARKHRNHTVPLLRALDGAGLDGIALCWGPGGAAVEIRREGLKAVALESWVAWGSLAGSWFRTWRTWRLARARRRQFLAEATGEEQLLRDILWDSLRIFFTAELPQRQRLFGAMGGYWRDHPARAARLWTRVLWQGVVAYRALPAGPRPLLFWQPGWPYQVPSPYKQVNVPVDQVYAICPEHVRQLQMTEQFAADRIAVAGLPWMEGVRRFKAEHSRAESRRRLGLPTDPALCVFCDPGYFIRGYMAAAEQALLLTALLDLAHAQPQLYLVIKPHPSHAPGALESIVRSYGLANVTVVPQSDLPYHALNAADLLVTKFSTLAIEGMILGVPAMAALFDGEQKFACYEDAIEYVGTPAELRGRLTELLADPIARETWAQKLRTKSAAYLSRHCAGHEDDPNQIIARHLALLLS